MVRWYKMIKKILELLFTDYRVRPEGDEFYWTDPRPLSALQTKTTFSYYD